MQSVSEDYSSAMETADWEHSSIAGKPLPAADSMPDIGNPEYVQKSKGKRGAVTRIQTDKRGKRQDFATKSSYRVDISIGAAHREDSQGQPRIEADQTFEVASSLGFAEQSEACHGQHPMEQDFESREMSYFEPDRRVSSFGPPSIFPRRLHTWSFLPVDTRR